MVRIINKWEIYFCNLNPVQGSEQRGLRPVIVISNDDVNHNLPVSAIIPLSSIKPNDKIYPTEVKLSKEITGLQKDSVAMIQQIRTVSHNRFNNKAGIITDSKHKKIILDTIRLYFEL
ncbi:MAG: type II toxin-antitoxin system PemK/MazF family toxin [Oscillospiraceae bacterium]|nr:type II toxin-antitoxin system PemK/MazF family toxin [Oscillospiraceae bacterium]